MMSFYKEARVSKWSLNFSFSVDLMAAEDPLASISVFPYPIERVLLENIFSDYLDNPLTFDL